MTQRDGAPDAPSRSLSVEQVVGAQLDALRSEPQDGAAAGPGIQRAWRFASPGNQAATGPVDRFAAMLRDLLYVGLLEHVAVALGPLVLDGDQARQEVLVVTLDDRTEGYTWVLGRQVDPPFTGCWMTEAVLRHPGPDA